MPTSAQSVYIQVVRTLPPTERLRLATLILNELVEQDSSVIDRSDRWTDRDIIDLNNFSLQYAATLFPEDEETVE
ncbi:MAG: hypothetical protein HC836_02820 [Richelia sp. RM2_1_2]|uniref:Uncharacterized protein n=2 Tax=Plectonema TaxID=1183 RepID=A0A8J7F7V0_9CYAN|nr:hypothetical protein [Plectonema cf. radiosum LEGE 06105]NJL78168.1 hypothetical protein [Richelia sp. SM2_1_7]NJM21188.1 hypothetical protein [Richelia sp. SM1_7_0]NJN06861.1 hypothetical protein [Richelia sp. RM1_1_1]NJO57341.1 hypothetical protein [Richelia sp. RM2_1_2]